MRRAIFFFSCCLLASSVAVAGCASADDGAAASDDEAVAASSDEITVAARGLVAQYFTRSPASGGFARLDLRADGSYTAKVEAGATQICFTSPCLLDEAGQWNAYGWRGQLRLRLRPAGAPARYYGAARTAKELTLTRGGLTERLGILPTGQCVEDIDCGAGELCPPQLCLMYCEVNDPSCCGPVTCEPRSGGGSDAGGGTGGGASDGGSCFGAWVDHLGGCRAPNDGAYPASCCAGLPGPTCGNVTCASGEVCCNPLLDICTKPGEYCAF